jgi:hypothetical protein
MSAGGGVLCGRGLRATVDPLFDDIGLEAADKTENLARSAAVSRASRSSATAAIAS